MSTINTNNATTNFVFTMEDDNDNQQVKEEEDEDDVFAILYHSMAYLLLLYIAGDIICGKFIQVIPPLVGQIGMGMLLGPNGIGFVVPTTSGHGGGGGGGWSLLGEIGLVLLLCQAGLEMDFFTLRQVGPKGAFMALVGSILPTTIGFLLAFFVLNLSTESALTVGCSFGPTSAGIALNVLQPCGILRTPLGQLIVAIAIVDDIIALVVLSQLQALTAATGEGETGSGSGNGVSASDIAIPIISALLWLFVGGSMALYVMPKILTQLTVLEEKIWMILHYSRRKTMNKANNSDNPPVEASSSSSPDIDDDPEEEEEERKESKTHDQPAAATILDTFTLAHITILLFALLPATYYTQASHLLGAFLAGLSSCQQPYASQKYNHELNKIIEWLLRLFFGASIAFVIPVQLFVQENGGAVIAKGFLLSLALLGKILTGVLFTPVHQLQQQQHEQEEENEGGALEPDERNNNDDDKNNTNTANITHRDVVRQQQKQQSRRRHRYDRQHIWDCLVVGFSMAGEAEFAMLVAGFGFREGLLEEDIYASTVFAILLSTILSPCLLRLTLALLVPKEGGGEEKQPQQGHEEDDDEELPMQEDKKQDTNGIDVEAEEEG